MVISITPLAKPRMTRSDKWNRRLVVMRYRAYGDELRLRLPNYALPDEFKVTFNIPIPTSWSTKKRESMKGQPHTIRPDIDNLTKALMDHLAKEDSYIWHVDAKKVWSEKGSIEVEEIV